MMVNPGTLLDPLDLIRSPNNPFFSSKKCEMCSRAKNACMCALRTQNLRHPSECSSARTSHVRRFDRTHKDVAIQRLTKLKLFRACIIVHLLVKSCCHVDKMRGGQKMSVFVHAQGIKTVHAGGRGLKKLQNSVHSC